MASADKTSWGKYLLVLLVLGGVYRLAVKKLPPFERGEHPLLVTAHAAGTAPQIGPCEVFPADNVWNTAIDKQPVDAKSQVYIDSIGNLKKLHPDFGASLDNGIPFTVVPQGTKGVPVDFEYHDDSDLGNYPIPEGAPIESGSDHHLILVDEGRCILYELFDVKHEGGAWKAGSGIKMDLQSNQLRADGKTSGDAAGLPILPGLLRYDEVQSGEVRHALRFTIQHTQRAYVWPARHFASSIKDTNVAPLGERFRLRADFDISKYSKSNQVILTTLKKYGMFLADNGSVMYLSGVPDKRWDDDDLHHLGDLKAEDFEAVDESGLQMMPDSARVDPVALR